MKFAEIKEKFAQEFKVRKLDDQNFVVYFPFYFMENEQNFPLLIHEEQDYVILTEQGFLINDLFEEDKDYQENKKEIIEILNDFGMELNKGCMELKCKVDEVFIKISTYLQALSVINYLFK